MKTGIDLTYALPSLKQDLLFAEHLPCAPQPYKSQEKVGAICFTLTKLKLKEAPYPVSNGLDI